MIDNYYLLLVIIEGKIDFSLFKSERKAASFK